jgi:DNA-binding NtrC family response regulator
MKRNKKKYKNMKFNDITNELVNIKRELNKEISEDIIRNLQEKERILLRRRDQLLSEEKSGKRNIPGNDYVIIGKDNYFQEQLDKLYAYARQDTVTAVTIQGEPGTGKKLFSKYFQSISDIDNDHFFKLDCEKLSKEQLEIDLFGSLAGKMVEGKHKGGIFSIYDHGILYLENSHCIPIEIQDVLAKYIESREGLGMGDRDTYRTNIRIIFSFNTDIEELRNKSIIAFDLYENIKNNIVRIPPLRERKDDIELLVRYFLDEMSTRIKKTPIEVSEFVLIKLRALDWKEGNVSELKRLLERMVNELPRGQKILDTLNEEENYTYNYSVEKFVYNVASLKIDNNPLPIDEVVRLYLEKLREQYGSYTKVAKALGMPHSTIYSMVKRRRYHK